MKETFKRAAHVLSDHSFVCYLLLHRFIDNPDKNIQPDQRCPPKPKNE